MSKTLFLIGFMASGKSTLGKKLANSFKLEFIDLDKYIEEQEGLSINELFEQKGEDYFREIENKYLKQLDLENKVIACGGGTPIYKDNMHYMKEHGVVLYLVVPTEILIGRLRQQADERPLVNKLSDEELKEFVYKTLEQRKTLYENADILVPHTKSFALLKMELNFLIA